MEINYFVIGIVFFAVMALIVLINVKNKRDKKKMEEEMNQGDLKPEQHDKNTGI